MVTGLLLQYLAATPPGTARQSAGGRDARIYCREDRPKDCRSRTGRAPENISKKKRGNRYQPWFLGVRLAIVSTICGQPRRKRSRRAQDAIDPLIRRHPGRPITMLDGFNQSMIDTGEAKIAVTHGGNGPPLLLVHRHPKTHVMGHRVAPQLPKSGPMRSTPNSTRFNPTGTQTDECAPSATHRSAAERC